MSRLVTIPADEETKAVAITDITCMEDDLLPWREKGILIYLLTRPKGWKFSIRDLLRAAPGGKNSIYNSLDSLRRKKYLHRIQIYASGKISEWVIFVFPRPTEIETEKLQKMSEKSSDFYFPISRKKGNSIPYIYNNIYISDIPKAPKGKTSTPKKSDAQIRSNRFMIFAEKLAEIIQKVKNIQTPTRRLRSWADDFRKLHEQEGVSRGRMKAAMIWYRHNIGGQYVPVIESGASFRSKFLKLESAMERAGDLDREEDEPPKQKRKFRVGH